MDALPESLLVVLALFDGATAPVMLGLGALVEPAGRKNASGMLEGIQVFPVPLLLFVLVVFQSGLEEGCILGISGPEAGQTAKSRATGLVWVPGSPPCVRSLT